MKLFHTERSIWYIVPTQNLRLLILRNARKLLPGCNYIVQWKDVQGYGIQLAITEERFGNVPV